MNNIILLSGSDNYTFRNDKKDIFEELTENSSNQQYITTVYESKMTGDKKVFKI